MSYTRITVDVQDKVGHLILSQPDEYNRMPPAFWEEFPDALESLDRRGDVRALVISSTGKHFTAGMDVSAFTTPREQTWDRGRTGEMARRNLNRLQGVFTRLETVRMPVLAAIQGGCVGGGVDLVAACDVRYCTADAFFCIQEINIGLAADVGTLQRLPKLIPDGLMRELAYTGRRLPAAEALPRVLVNQVFEAGHSAGVGHAHCWRHRDQIAARHNQHQAPAPLRTRPQRRRHPRLPAGLDGRGQPGGRDGHLFQSPGRRPGARVSATCRR